MPFPCSPSPAARRRAPALGAAVAIALLTGACTGPSTSPARDAAAVVSSLGSVPVPRASGVDPTATASAGHVQVLAMGAPVAAVLADGTTATVTASGPDQAITSSTTTTAGRPQTPATITVSVHAGTGTLHLAAADMHVRDERGAAVPISPHGPGEVDVSAGQDARLVVGGVFTAGAGAVVWQPAGRPLAVWDFTIELD